MHPSKAVAIIYKSKIGCQIHVMKIKSFFMSVDFDGDLSGEGRSSVSIGWTL